MKNLKLLGLGCLLSIYTTTASAELLIDPTDKSSMGKGKAGVFFGMSTVGYDFSSKGSFSIKRQYISGYYAYGFSKDIDVFIAGGYIRNASVKTENNAWNTSGDSGVMYGGGVRGGIVKNKIKINWYGQYIVIDEKLGNQNITGNFTGWSNGQYYTNAPYNVNINTTSKLNELSVGLNAISPYISYGITSHVGIEYIVLSDGKLNQTNFSQKNFERKDKLVFRFGAKKKIDNILFNINMAYNGSTESISIGASTKF